MEDFDYWWSNKELFTDPSDKEVSKHAWAAAVDETARRCRDIAVQRFRADNPAVSISKKISEEFKI